MPRIDPNGFARTALVLVALAASGCLGDDCDCPALPPLRVAEGVLRPTDAAGGTGTAERMELDRSAGVVTIVSVRDGHVVTERWRVTSAAAGY